MITVKKVNHIPETHKEKNISKTVMDTEKNIFHNIYIISSYIYHNNTISLSQNRYIISEKNISLQSVLLEYIQPREP